jgi:hypothetical protein
MTLRPLRSWYEKMSTRERFILLAFAWVAVIIWGQMLSAQVKKLRVDITVTQSTLKKQQDSLNKKLSVEAKIKNYQQVFQTSIDSTALVPRVRNYAVAANIPSPTISSSATEAKKDSIFNVNAVTIHFAKTPLRDLVDFAARVNNDHPYLVIDEVDISDELLNPRLMDGEIRVKSLELKPGALDVSSSPAKP